jgi:DNA-directed RNA polymerase subunit RPC12/RpoP
MKTDKEKIRLLEALVEFLLQAGSFEWSDREYIGLVKGCIATLTEQIKDEEPKHPLNELRDFTMTEKSKEEKEKDFKCSKCGMEFNSLDALGWHKTVKGKCGETPEPVSNPDELRKVEDKTAKQFIIDTFGESWLHFEWSAGDVMDAMDDFAELKLKVKESLQGGQSNTPSGVVSVADEEIDELLADLGEQVQNTISYEVVRRWLRDRLSQPTDEGKVWDCPSCGFRIADLEYMNVKHDFGCPECGTSFTEFKSKTT